MAAYLCHFFPVIVLFTLKVLTRVYYHPLPPRSCGIIGIEGKVLPGL